MVDIHSHILPGLDDGAQTLEESVAMLRIAAESGTTDIVATPHANVEYTFDPEVVSAKIREVQEAVGSLIRIHAGCDFHMKFDLIEDLFQNPTRYTINGKGYLMVEFSDLIILPTTDVVFDRMNSAGIVPVVTHPERNPLLQQRLDQLERWARNGVLLQITAQSLLGRFGPTAKRVSDQLLDRNLVHFVASDAHDTEDRTPRLDLARQYVSKHWGESRADRLFRRNPAAVLKGEPLPAPEETEMTGRRKRKWYQFWA